MEYVSIPGMFRHISDTYGDRTGYRHKRDGRWVDVTWAESRAVADRVAKSLIALGVGPGERVAVLSDTRLEWVLCDFGITTCGGVTVGIYPTNPGQDCAYIINHSDVELLFVENNEQLDKIRSVRSELASLRVVVILDGAGDGTGWVLSWEEFLERSEGHPDHESTRKKGLEHYNELKALER